MQELLFIISLISSLIVVLGGGAILYINSDVWHLSDDTIFPYASGEALSNKVDVNVYKKDNIGVYKNSSIQALSDKVDVYKNNSGLPSFTDHNMICKSPTSYDWLSVSPHRTQPVRMNTKWVCDLYHELEQIQSKQLTLLMCNKDYLEVLANWLAHAILHAHHPVDNILIIATDSFTRDVMRHKGIHSVFISVGDVFNLIGMERTNEIWMTKLVVARLLNHWNYNVFAFDTDALIMKNLQPLLDRFSTSDIVASSSGHPATCSKKWNAPTMCMGAILYKSSPATEQFWMTVGTVSGLDDQIITNTALDRMGVQFNKTNDDITYYTGITRGNTPLTVTTFPQELMCHRGCNQKLLKQYYIWHNHADRKTGESKRTNMIANHVWLLNDRVYDSINTITTPKQWLLNITKHDK